MYLKEKLATPICLGKLREVLEPKAITPEDFSFRYIIQIIRLINKNMSAYSTKNITREEAEKMVEQCRMKNDRSVKALSNEELDKELHEYVYSENYEDIVGVLLNYEIIN